MRENLAGREKVECEERRLAGRQSRHSRWRRFVGQDVNLDGDCSGMAERSYMLADREGRHASIIPGSQ